MRVRAWSVGLLIVLTSWGSLRAADIDLNGPWKMKDFTRGMGVQKGVQRPGHSQAGFLNVTVPTTERAALLKAGEIPDPYVGTNNEGSLWTEEKEWWFLKAFTVPAALRGQSIDVVFDGIVYRGEVWLNGEPLGRMEGMFNPFAFPVSKALRYGEKNYLAVRLEAPEDATQRNLVRGYQYDLQPDRPQRHVISQSLYCWDWAPHMVVTGIWRPVRLRVSGPLRVERPWVRSTLMPARSTLIPVRSTLKGDPARPDARLDIQVETTNTTDQDQEATLIATLKPKTFNGESRFLRQSLRLAPRATVQARFEVDLIAPRLWWPNGMGDPDLYTCEVKVLCGGRPSESATTSFGIRELKIVANENTEAFLKSMADSVQTGASSTDLVAVQHLGKVVGAYPWTFQINGKKMFAKGSNWVPADQMLRLDRARYAHLLDLARDAHFNLFRVWGGGLFETEDFYELCDEKGLLNWFEFLSSSDFSGIDRDRFTQAARAALRRIRNHPSLTYYCGGNEFDPDDKGVKDLIDRLGEVVKAEDPDREFHRASPYMGDDHYWGVWHRFAPYTEYRRVRPFRSEAGLNALPVLENYRKFTPDDKLWPVDAQWLEYRGSYQVNFSHLPKQDRYANEFGPASGIAEYIRHSQMAQALADGFNIEFCRSKKFQNSGVLIWQFNDAYPCASWSLVDWYGTPKAAYYAARRACRPLHVAADFETYLWKPGATFKAALSLLNDLDLPQSHLKVESILMDLQGHLLDRQESSGDVGANASRPVLTHTWRIPENMEGRSFLLAVRLRDAAGTLISELLYPMAARTTTPIQATPEQAKDRGFNRFAHYANILDECQKLPRVEPDLRAEALPGEARVWRITLRNPGSGPLFDARLRLDGEDETFRAAYSDNHLSLLPGEERRLTVRLTPLKPGPLTVPHLQLEAWNASAACVLAR
ncbi:glycosyl hydrolase [Geothrix limicola]|uniref:Glycosyl hydrolase n=1 Tax=Geothrix limicola TaxID=2927978 RepID=A0ABQ5QH12_9BACT|nr:sugar-binding domain-containing protein [Geothrix limicola]GLH73460.1 glycosyl hydrolase [Geothrix limicola]